MGSKDGYEIPGLDDIDELDDDCFEIPDFDDEGDGVGGVGSSKVSTTKNSEPISCQCGNCGEWSNFSVAHNTKPPKGWADDEKGYACKDCQK